MNKKSYYNNLKHTNTYVYYIIYLIFNTKPTLILKKITIKK